MEAGLSQPIQAPAREIRLASSVHIGASPSRTLLEDRARAEQISTAGGLTLALAIVADGIGGENAGERAAELTVSAVMEHVRASRETNVARLLESALIDANSRVYAESRKSRRKTNMGSTAAVAAISDGRLYVANAGDSRIYLLRGSKAYPLTVDHTWQVEVVRSGKLTAAEAARHPRRDDIVRSIGYEAEVDVDLGLWLGGSEISEAEARAAQGLPLQPGDTVLVCSDGLIKSRHDQTQAHYVEASEFAPLVRGRSPKSAASELIKRALDRQVDDNVSVAILEVPGGVYWRRYLVPGAAAAGLLVLLIVVGAWAAPRLDSRLAGPDAAPTIPALPSGVAFVSEVRGRAELTTGTGEFQPVRAEQLISAGPEVRVRTGGASYLRLGLANQTVLYLGPESELGMLEIAGSDGTLLVLLGGTVVVSDQSADGNSTVVAAPNGTTARLLGSLMGARWQAAAGVFDVDCFHDLCEVTLASGSSLTLVAGQHLAVSTAGEPAGPDSVQIEHYAFAGYAGGLVAAPTAAPGAIAGGTAPTRTPLGPLFISPTPPPPPPPTNTPQPPPGPPPPAPTQPPPPTNTSPPPTDTPEPTDTPADTPGPRPSKTPKPTDTEPPPPPSETPEDG